MTLDEILENDLPRWAQITKEDPVLFSRIALFRNVKGIHFPSRLTGGGTEEVLPPGGRSGAVTE